jgi:hypothetical protein
MDLTKLLINTTNKIALCSTKKFYKSYYLEVVFHILNKALILAPVLMLLKDSNRVFALHYNISKLVIWTILLYKQNLIERAITNYS